ncbi:MAG: hypothetical protein LBC61_02005 [Candidatus Peribacteria bacterium]|jgi:hypothetical protein|nr:hypothetical protein [Candidatus Peribacteria bacterium]
MITKIIGKIFFDFFSFGSLFSTPTTSSKLFLVSSNVFFLSSSGNESFHFSVISSLISSKSDL